MMMMMMMIMLYQDEIPSGAGIRLQNRSLDDPDRRTLTKMLLA